MNAMPGIIVKPMAAKWLALLLTLLLFYQPVCFCQLTSASKSTSLLLLCKKFDSLSILVRDNKISKQNALQQLQKLMPFLTESYNVKVGKSFPASSWVFPLQGYGSKAIGGTNGNGYMPNGYNYFDGNKHGGHPAHDIFINDKNQDNLDDKTKSFVNVLSMTGGVVVSMETKWDTSSLLKGGKYIWVFDPSSTTLFFYPTT